MNMPSVKLDMIQMKGGLDQMTPTTMLASGFVRESSNFECGVTGGYSRIAGYERFDGRPKPSDAIYALLYVSSFITLPAVGNTVTDGAASGVVCAVGIDHVAITMQVGAFTIGHNLMLGASVVGVLAVPTTGLTADVSAQYTYAASERYRQNITAVPGTGAALGCTLYKDVLYAFRATVADPTVIALYKSSTSGWTLVPFYKEISFSSGVSALTHPKDGDTLTQGGVTATIKRVVLQSGAWGTNATGRLIITTPSGGNFAAGASTAGAVSFPLTLAATQTSITMQSGGKFEFAQANFAGGATTDRVYGCDGINRAFEFDGDVLVPLTTNTVPDTPKHIEAHKNVLFLAIGSSLIYSSPGLPYNYQAADGAGEVAAGEEITGLKVLPGAQTTATMLVTSRHNTFMVYGISTTNLNFVTYNTGAGAIDYSIQNMAETYWMDDRGVVSLQTTLNFGNFEQSTLTAHINRFIEQKRTRVSSSSLERRKSQYRIFFNDGTGLYITVVNQKLMGCMPVYFPDPVYQTEERKFSTGDVASFFCSTDGFVYQMEKGTSFDGQSIDAYFTMTYNASGSARTLKRYRKAALEVSGAGYAAISFGYLLGYSNPDISQSQPVAYSSNIQPMQWDNFTWDNFYWDGRTIVPNECEMNGTGENLAITIRSGTAYYQPFTINSALVHYTPRRLMR